MPLPGATGYLGPLLMILPPHAHGQPAKERKTPPCSNHNDGVPAPCVSERGARLKVGAAKKTP
jgi:hypothetical protein